MTLKNQFMKLKENWLLVLVVVVLLLVPMFSGSIGSAGISYSKGGYGEMEMMEATSARMGGVYMDNDFAPEVERRIITKSASLNGEVERGEFKETETKLKSILKTTDSFLLNENVNLYGEGSTAYFQGRYSIKVETSKYDAIVVQLKELGEVTAFHENKDDVTGRYTNLNVDLSAEKERLARFEQMYAEAKDINDKINLNDRIFNQERTVKYLEESLKNIDNRVDYSTVSLTLVEEKSGYVGMAVIKFSKLVKNFVNSFNGLIGLIFLAIPYLIVAGLIWLIVRIVRKRK
jgi:hypothetical protein